LRIATRRPPDGETPQQRRRDNPRKWRGLRDELDSPSAARKNSAHFFSLCSDSQTISLDRFLSDDHLAPTEFRRLAPCRHTVVRGARFAVFAIRNAFRSPKAALSAIAQRKKRCAIHGE
jgi:hypothetical protein